MSPERIRSAVELMARDRPIAGGWRISSSVRQRGEGETGEEQPAAPARPGPIAWALRAGKTIDLADAEARRRHHREVGPEELLLGLIDGGDNVATTILESLGVDPAAPRQGLLEELGPPPSS